jgi:hypothetical protein
MTGLGSKFADIASGPTAAIRPSCPKSNRTTRDCPRVTVRLSQDDHARLTDLAGGMALSTYLRAAALGQDLPRRRAAGLAVQDREAIAQLLGLLGQSRIANNLNQLAHQANIGTLPVDEETKTDIDEAYRLVVSVRATLMRALGMKE